MVAVDGWPPLAATGGRVHGTSVPLAAAACVVVAVAPSVAAVAGAHF